jgi:hypothetical protein
VIEKILDDKTWVYEKQENNLMYPRIALEWDLV